MPRISPPMVEPIKRKRNLRIARSCGAEAGEIYREIYRSCDPGPFDGVVERIANRGAHAQF